MVILKQNKFAAIAMISTFITAALPALAQTSAEQQQLIQGISLIRTVVEWVVLLSLIFSTIASVLLIGNRPSRWIDDLFSLLMPPIILGVTVCVVAFLLENWTPFLIFDACFALIMVVMLLINAVTYSVMHDEPQEDEEDTLRDEYDLKSLQIRKLGPGRKSFNGKTEELD